MAVSTAKNELRKIVHLDIGRKYFSVDSICRMIDTMAECGYDELQLAFGNDGLRLLLDDMAMDGQTDEAVKAAVRAGNLAYNGDESCLTQDEMDEILAYAKRKAIEIVPMLNLPGHMVTALNINPAYKWKSNGMVSGNSLDVKREADVAFGMELLKKYASYFAQKGCRVFNFGADEYGNDIYEKGGLGFAQLEKEGRYDAYVSFLNRAAHTILEAGMTPRAFNDGFYYHENTDVDINPAIQVCYWGKGWIGFDCASVSTVAGKGHPMINSHGGWYYVLKHEGIVQKPTEHMTDGIRDFESFRAECFPGDQIYEEPAGAMFCIWCDHSNLRTDLEVAADASDEIRAMYTQVMQQKTETE